MVPEDIVKVPEIPLLGSGKTDYASTRRMAMETLGLDWRRKPQRENGQAPRPFGCDFHFVASQLRPPGIGACAEAAETPNRRRPTADKVCHG